MAGQIEEVIKQGGERSLLSFWAETCRAKTSTGWLLCFSLILQFSPLISDSEFLLLIPIRTYKTIKLFKLSINKIKKKLTPYTGGDRINVTFSS